MNQNISPIIKPAELIELYPNNDLVIVDASNGIGAKYNYDLNNFLG